MSSSNLKSMENEQEEQLYLLEVIVDSLDVHKEGILETFLDKSNETVSGEAPKGGRPKQKQGPIKVLVKFYDFPTIEIMEREFKENEEQQNKQGSTKEDSAVPVDQDSIRTPDQGTSTENDSIYKSRKTDGTKGSSMTVPAESSAATQPSNKFTSGKSCLFPMVPKEMMDVIRRNPVDIQVHREATYNEPAHLIGKTRLNLGQEFIDAIALANTPTVLPVSALIQDDFEMTNVFGDVTGTVSLMVRLSCFGATIFTQFKYIQGQKGFKFSTSEGVMKSKGEATIQKKDVPLLEDDKFDERVPYFTGDENIGMYSTTTSCDEKFKLPVPWRKLHEEPISPRVCGPKRLFKESAAQKSRNDCPLYDFNQMFPSVGQSSVNSSGGRYLHPGQPMISGNIFEGAYCHGQELPSTVYVPPEFGRKLPSEVERLVPGQRGSGKGALDIPPGTKFACQFGADWYSEAQTCSCSSKNRKNKPGVCCMSQAQMVNCPTAFGGSWRANASPPSYTVCTNAPTEKSRDYPPLEQAPPHLQSAVPPQSPDSLKLGNITPVSSLHRPDVRYIPCPNSPETRSGGTMLCGLEALADPNQRNLQNLLKPTLLAPKCPPDSSRNMPSLCTCPKVPTVVPPPVPGGVLRCECSNILSALKPIDMPFTCRQPESPPMTQPAQNYCPPCPPVPINLPPPAPECPLAKLLKEAQNETKQEPVKSPAAKLQHSATSPEPPHQAGKTAKQDDESIESPNVNAENQKHPTTADVSSKPSPSSDEHHTPIPESKTKRTTKDKVNKILQEEVAVAQSNPTTNTTNTSQRDLEEKTSKTTSLSSGTAPSSKKRKVNKKVEGKSKEHHQPPPQLHEKELNIAYTPTAGIYPGMVIGHKNCVPVIRLVPKRMGWLWNIKDADGFMKPGRGWRPGSIQTNVMKVMDNVKTTTNKQSKEKRAVKATRSDHHPRKAESGRLLATGGGDAPMYLPIDLTPTLHLHKKHGEYYVSMCPPKEQRKGQRPKKKKMNALGDMVEESASDDSRPAQFRIDLKNPDNLDLNRELYESDSTSSNSEDSYQMELVAPSSMRNRQPQAIKVDMEIQCTEDDFTSAPIESKHADKPKKSTVSNKKSLTSQKSKGKKKKSAKVSGKRK